MVKDYAALARLGHVSRARVSQVMALLSLAPDLQEAVLFLPRTVRGRDPDPPVAAAADRRGVGLAQAAPAVGRPARPLTGRGGRQTGPARPPRIRPRGAGRPRHRPQVIVLEWTVGVA